MAADNNTTDAPPSLGPVLVTGGCGFIGSHIVEGIRTLYPEVDVHVLDLNIDRYRIFGATYHKCDLSNAAEVEAVFLKAKPKTVFHTACPDSMVVKPEIFKRVNVDGTHNMVAACRKVGTVQAFVNTSTSSVIHDNVSDLIDAGDDLPVLKYPVQKRIYTLTKAEGEAIILAANRSDGDASMLTVTLRPASVFGERDHVCMGKIVDACRAGRGRFQIGPGKNLYDFAYVGNVVHAHILSAQALLRAYGKPAPPADKRVDGQAFNVTNDERWLFWDFQRAVSASVGLPVKPEEIKVVPIWAAKLAAGISEWTTWFRTFGKGHPPVSREAVHLTTIHRTMNGDKIRDRLGYKPKYSIQEGLDRAGKWFVEEAKREAAEKEKKEGVNQ